MSRSADTVAAGASDGRATRWDVRGLYRSVFSTARRHSITAFGPVSVSGANFITTLLILRSLSSLEFGQFSFLVVATGLCISLANGLLGAPLAAIAHVPVARVKSELETYFKASLAFAAGFALAVACVALTIGVRAAPAAAFGVYAGAMSLRLVARTYSYTQSHVRAVVLSDGAYSAALLFGTWLLAASGHINLLTIAVIFAVSAACALVLFGKGLAMDMVQSLKKGSLRAYAKVWQDMTRWAVLGVVTSEMTINAHAYLVTFISGSRAFALIAVGALFTRPFSLALTALPDREAPALARTIAAGRIDRALRSAREYLFVVVALWAANQILAGGILAWFPGAVTKKGYDIHDIVWVVAIWAAIMAVRGLRSPENMLLLAAREFRPLANASVISSVVALISTLILLLAFGPIPSLLGILAGDIALWLAIRAGVRNWKHRNAAAPEKPGMRKASATLAASTA